MVASLLLAAALVPTLGGTVVSTSLSVVKKGAAASSPSPDVREHLASVGLACCVDAITRRGGWFTSGGGVDATSDLKYLDDDLISRLPLPHVKQNILKSVAASQREDAWRQRADDKRREGWTRHWLENALAAIETMSRGFALGFGLSYLFETLFLDRSFYLSKDEELVPRLRRAAFRASALGVAVAVTIHGLAIVVPHSWRQSWLAGGSY